ncbi:retinol dehydrogenase 14-like [Tachypleus tridentatus]|uniref:retinol dehydrogenase 14-like n=1 Tax=Tachypleus tridentatus TaxID=6853 RepID=UPI003FD51822
MAATVVFTGVCVFLFVSIFAIRQYKVHFSWKKCKSKRLMKGKTVIITGCNSGIGKATAKELAAREARVILACRNEAKAREAVQDIRKVTASGELIIKELDLSSMASVRRFVKDILNSENRIDVLINNAGVFQCPYLLTEDGFEMQMCVNHLGHFLLTNLLLDKMEESSPSRIVVVTSVVYKRGIIDFGDFHSKQKYDKRLSYCNSKLANVLFVKELHRRLQLKGDNFRRIHVYAVSPGMVWTNLGRYVKTSWLKMILLLPLALLFVKMPSQGCQTVLHCAISEEVEDESGKYYRDCKEETYSQNAQDEKIAEKLWELSERLTGLKET